MFVEFTQELYKKLIGNEFTWIYNKTKDLTEDTKYIQLIKYIGPLLYIVNIINIDKIGLETYKNNLEVYKDSVQLDKLDTEHIILTNIFVTENPFGEIIQILSENSFEPNELIHIVPYIVDITNNNLILAKYNIDNVLNISSYIKESLDSIKDSNNSEIACLETIGKEIKKDSILKIKTNNTYFTYGLMLINILVALLMYFQQNNFDMIELLIKFGANSRDLILQQKQYWRLFTSMFIHIGALHLMYNCFSLYLFGIRVEKYFGKGKFIFIYFFSGIFGNILSILFSVSVSAGASGAIYGLIGAIFAMTQQKNKNVDGMTFYLITTIAVIGIAFGFLDISVNNYAHIGGLLTGYILGFLLCPE